MVKVSITLQISAPIDLVWREFIVHENMPSWADVKSVMLAKEGSSDRNGLGAIRHVEFYGGRVLIEEIVHFVDLQEMHYCVTSGIPGCKYHLGKIFFKALDENKTQLDWYIDVDFHWYHPIYCFGWLMMSLFRRKLHGALCEFAKQMDTKHRESS